MPELTSAAAILWDSYLLQVRKELSHLDRTEIIEVEEDLELHLQTEISNAKHPVSEQKIRSVIDRLGTPSDLAAALGSEQTSHAELEASDQVLVFSGLILLLASLFFPLLLFATIPVSVTLARMALTRPGVSSSHFRMACYPVLLVGYLSLGLVVLFWPLLPVLPLAANGGILYGLFAPTENSDSFAASRYWIQTWSVAFTITGLWWLVLAGLSEKLKRQLPRVFFPFVTTQQFAARGVLLAGALLQLAIAIVVLVLV